MGDDALAAVEEFNSLPIKSRAQYLRGAGTLLSGALLRIGVLDVRALGMSRAAPIGGLQGPPPPTTIMLIAMLRMRYGAAP